MDFLRKNLGFVVFTSVGVVLLVGLIVLDRKAAASLSKSKASSDKQQDFIRQISRGTYELNKTNLQRARRNHEIAKTELHDFLRRLEDRYTLPARSMASGVECISEVRETIRELASTLQERDIRTPEEQYFSFRELAMSSFPPSLERVPIILKQLDVAKIVVGAAADAYVTEFVSLERLDTPRAGEEKHRVGGTQTALYRVSVRGTGNRIRAFISKLNEQQRVLFLIKEPRFTRDKQQLARANAETRDREGRGRRPAPLRPPDMDEMYDPEFMRAETAPEDEAPAVVPREERRVFDSVPLQATITLGLLEFRAPEDALGEDRG